MVLYGLLAMVPNSPLWTPKKWSLMDSKDHKGLFVSEAKGRLESGNGVQRN